MDAPPPPQAWIPETAPVHERPSLGTAIGVGVAVVAITAVAHSVWTRVGFALFPNFLDINDSKVEEVFFRYRLFVAPVSGVTGFFLHFLLGRRNRLREGLSGGAIWIAAILFQAVAYFLVTELFDWAPAWLPGVGAIGVIGLGTGMIRGLTRRWPAPLLLGAIAGVSELAFHLTLSSVDADTSSIAALSLLGGLVSLVLSAIILAHFAPAPFTYGGTNDHFA